MSVKEQAYIMALADLGFLTPAQAMEILRGREA